MKYMNGKAKMLVEGIVLGTGTMGMIAVLIAEGRIGRLGLLAVALLIGLSGVSGWILGVQMRAKLDRDRIWIQGYRAGRTGEMFRKRKSGLGSLPRNKGRRGLPPLMQPPTGAGRKPRKCRAGWN